MTKYNQVNIDWQEIKISKKAIIQLERLKNWKKMIYRNYKSKVSNLLYKN